MKIKAPEHDASTKQGKFPEPSPAACGKRKLAEIAAARMLAGVAAVGGQSLLGSTTEDGTATPPPEKEPSLQIPAPPQIDKVENSGVKRSLGLSLQIVNPEALGISYGQQKQRKDLAPAPHFILLLAQPEPAHSSLIAVDGFPMLRDGISDFKDFPRDENQQQATGGV